MSTMTTNLTPQVKHSEMDSETRIVVIGRTGSGKSATGNSILGSEVFESFARASSVTSETKVGRANRFGREVLVVDTPGLFDTTAPNEVVIREISRCISMTAPGPHAFLFVIQVGRFTRDDRDTVTEFQKYFGEVILDYLIVLFTQADHLKDQTIEQYVRDVPPGLADLLQRSKNRYIAFNNVAPSADRDKQAGQLLGMIESMVKQNGGSCYTNEMYVEAGKALECREERVRRELELERLRERQEIERRYEQEIEKIQEQLRETVQQVQAYSKRVESPDGTATSAPREPGVHLNLNGISQTVGGANDHAAVTGVSITIASGNPSQQSTADRKLLDHLLDLQREREQELKRKLVEKEQAVIALQTKCDANETQARNLSKESPTPLEQVWRDRKKVGREITRVWKQIF